MYVETGDMEYSVRFASCMVSCFIEDFDIERMPNKEAIKYYMGNRILIDFTSVRELTVYLAGPFFTQQELDWVNSIEASLTNCGFRVLSPWKENGIINLDTKFEEKKDIFLFRFRVN